MVRNGCVCMVVKSCTTTGLSVTCDQRIHTFISLHMASGTRTTLERPGRLASRKGSATVCPWALCGWSSFAPTHWDSGTEAS